MEASLRGGKPAQHVRPRLDASSGQFVRYSVILLRVVFVQSPMGTHCPALFRLFGHYRLDFGGVNYHENIVIVVVIIITISRDDLVAANISPLFRSERREAP